MGIETALLAAGAAGSLAGGVSGLMNAGTGASAARAQNDIAFRNYYMQQRLARLQEEMATAGSTNARGDRTEYVPGVGWVERPTEQTRGIIAASDNEERRRLTEDATRGRLRREDNYTRQVRDGQDADAIMGGIRTGQQTPDDLRAAMIEAGVARAVSGGDDMRKRIGLVSLRQGTGGQEALARIGRNAMGDTRTAIADARLNAPAEYQERRSARVNPRLNQYQALVSRASAPDDVQFQPTNLDEGLGQTLRSRMNMAPQGIGSAMNVDTPRIGSTENRTPVALDSLGQYLVGLNRMGTRNGWWGGSAAGTNRTPSGGTASNWGNYADYAGFDDYMR